MARVVIYALLALYLVCAAPVAIGQDSAPPDVPAPVMPAPAPQAQSQLVVTINEAVAGIGALVVALSALGVALRRVWVAGKQIRVLIGGVEKGADPNTKAAIAEKAKDAGVGNELAARVERETKRLGGAS